MSSPGRLCIFNHQFFESDPNKYRIGSEYDVKSLQKVFGKYGVRSKVFTDSTKDEVIKQMKKISGKIDYANKSCLVIAILSHGGQDKTILACGKNHKNEIYSIQNEIINHIIRIPTLHGKPKIIIIQACRYEREDCILSTSVSITGSPADPTQLYGFYSTTETFPAYRKACGSVFIKTFCAMLDDYGEKESIEKIMDRTIKSVKENSLKLLNDGSEQCPSKEITYADPPYIFGEYFIKDD